MAGLHLHSLLRPEAPLLQKIHPRKRRASDYLPPLPSGYKPPSPPLSIPSTLAPGPDSPVRICGIEPPPSHPEPDVRLLATGL